MLDSAGGPASVDAAPETAEAQSEVADSAGDPAVRLDDPVGTRDIEGAGGDSDAGKKARLGPKSPSTRAAGITPAGFSKGSVVSIQESSRL